MAQRRNLRAVPETTRRAGLYARVSDVHGRSGEGFLSPDQQLDTMRDYCERAGWEIGETWIDLDRTGRNLNRPGIQKAVNAVESGQVDALVVYDLSRLARDVLGGLTIMRRVEDAGGAFVSVHEHIDSSPTGRHTAHTMLSVAQLYSDQMSARTSDTTRRVWEQGRGHGPPPIGYRKTTEPGVWEPDPEWASFIADCFTRYANGASVRTLWTDISRRRGKPYDRNLVRKMLAHPAYIGKMRLLGQVRDGRQPPIVSEAVWETVQRRLAETAATTPKRRHSATWSLSGLGVCDLCGTALGHQQIVTRSGKDSRVRCPPSRMPGQPKCAGVGYPLLAVVEAEVLRKLEEHAGALVDDVDVRLSHRAKRAAAKSTAVALRRDLANLRAARARTATDWAMRTITQGARDDVYATLDPQIAALESRLLELDDVAESPEARQARGLIRRMVAMWPDMAGEERRSALRACGVREIRLRPPVIRRSTVRGNDMTDRVSVEMPSGVL